jgi:predicted cupin superfamily sugar epimerase
MISADEIKTILGLQPLSQEGGFYKETYRCEEKIPQNALPERYSTSKNVSTAIFYLLTPDTCSRLHRLPSDEVYHFYLGDPVVMLQLHPNGKSAMLVIGPEIDKGQSVQIVVPRGTWQGSFLKEGGRFALLGATVSPAFDFSDYDAGVQNVLVQKYPGHKDLIVRLTPASSI